MNKVEVTTKENAVVALNIVSKLVQEIEKKLSFSNIKAKECEELKLLKEKCCDKNEVVSLSALHGIRHLVERRILVGSQTISMLVSLLPSVNQYGALVSTIGSVLLNDLQDQTTGTGEYECPYSMQVQHPFIMVLKYNCEKSWFEVYHFVLQLLQSKENMRIIPLHDQIQILKMALTIADLLKINCHLLKNFFPLDMFGTNMFLLLMVPIAIKLGADGSVNDGKVEHKIKFLRPVFRQAFWGSSWQGSQLRMKLFHALMLESDKREIMNFALEALLWQELDIHYCLFLQDLFINLLQKNQEEFKIAVTGLTPMLAEAIKWLIANGYNPGLWLQILKESLEIAAASNSTVLFILTDIVMQTPSVYINSLVDICKSIIFSTNCNKYVAYKFIAVILNWFVNPSFLANPVYKNFEEILEFVASGVNKWNDQTVKLNDNEYYKVYGSSKREVKFAVDLILATNGWPDGKSISNWLKNVTESNEHEMQCQLHSFIQGIILCESDRNIVNLCLDLLFNLIDRHKEISFSLLCLLFFKLGAEVDPDMQKIYLFSLPKLSVKKENISLIVGIIESLKRGRQKIMTPLVIQLYLSLWKFDNRTYSYLHKMLHDSTSGDFTWELNVSKAIALKEICRLAPHLHAKDLVGVLSRILNECSGNVSGLPSAIAIDAVTQLCKAYVIDVAGTWNAIQPKLRVDKRPKVIISLCKFFGEIPNLNSSGQKNEELIRDIVPMLWNYTFLKDAEVVRNAFRALSNFPLEDLPLKLFPEIYRVNIKLPKDLEKNSKSSEDILSLPYVPAECWVQFLEKLDENVLQDGGELVTVLIEKELTSLPRGIFYLPPEKSEPMSYSYLPSRSICRGLVERLMKKSNENSSTSLRYLEEIIRILSHEYSKLLPPLNWGFLEKLMALGPAFLRHSLALLAKQGSVSSSARTMLENYFTSVEWDSSKLEDILFIYNILPSICKFANVSYGTVQNFLDRTIKLCLESSLNGNGFHFEKILENISETLRSKSVQPDRKNMIAKQMEKVFGAIPPDHEVMKAYAKCATDFPVKSVEEITSVKEFRDVNSNWLRRAVTIRCAIAMRSDIKNPLVWLNEFIDAVAHFPEEQNFVLSTIWSIIRSRRDCDHRTWIQELTWRIQASITSSTGSESVAVTLFLIDVFVAAVIILSGYDCLFVDVNEFTGNESKKVDLFSHALRVLLFFNDWRDMLPKVGSWLQKLSKWKHLPQDRVKMLIQALLTLRKEKSFRDFRDENEFASLFDMFSLSLP